MRLFNKATLLFFLALAPVSFANANCPKQKAFLLNEVNAAIATYPNACISGAFNSITISCRVLFRNRLPSFVTVIANNDYRTLNQIADGLPGARAQLNSIILPSYISRMNSMINDIIAYDRNCAR